MTEVVKGIFYAQNKEVTMSIFKVKIIETLESEVSIESDTLSDAIHEAEERCIILSTYWPAITFPM